MHNDPDKYLERAKQRAAYAIEAESAEQIARNSKLIATELAQVRSAAFIDGQRYTTQTRIASEAKAINPQVVDAPPPRHLSPVPAGPSQSPTFDMERLADMVAERLRPAGVAMNADAPTHGPRIVTPDDPK